ncbi:uncharacterized protein LOC119765111 isoform X1 [Culex quinquefasciatus]|uniref:uncharacterized protein LOC119765111 isoform X1 n=1 Tax=Culex quinquefasciatus TaxID=7176 RepID=UPI0018E2D97A|nr:uncharacterized protein LOC119765111 isoform X1 [Culex quinquefasciatus]
MDTSAEFTYALIEAVRKRPILFSDALNFSKRREQYAAAWVEVAKDLGVEEHVASLKDRWRVIRCAHGRYLRVGYRMQVPGIHDKLSFLNPHMDIKPKEPKDIKPEDSLEYAIKLVNYVRQYPYLYDGSNALARPEAWEAVAAKLGGGATAESSMLTWKKIHYYYKFHLQKGYIAKPKGIAPYLAFLRPFIEEPVENIEFSLARELIETVQQYPALYDGTQSGQNVVLWNEVAQRLGNVFSVETYITKWAWMRGKYERHLKTGSKMVPCGIEGHLTFLNAFIAGFAPKRPLPASAEQLVRPVGKAVPATGRRVDRLHVDESDPDAQFLLTFLELMTKMSESQKRQFRIGAVKASRAVLDGVVRRKVVK